jgi:hypothetical protein
MGRTFFPIAFADFADVFREEKLHPIGLAACAVDLFRVNIGVVLGRPFGRDLGSFCVIIFFGRKISLAFSAIHSTIRSHVCSFLSSKRFEFFFLIARFRLLTRLPARRYLAKSLIKTTGCSRSR